MKLTLRNIELYERDVRFRLPFRFGVVTMTEAPQLFVRALVEMEGGSRQWGLAAEVLAPKWFDKDPQLSNEDNFEQLREAVRLCVEIYRSTSGFRSSFDLFIENYEMQIAEGARRHLKPLVASFGPALLDRAILDAVARHMGLSFSQAVKSNLPGIRACPPIADLESFDFGAFLKSLRPSRSVHARHTVGLSDAVRESDVNPEERVGDGLPESLESAIERYGNTYFKIKVTGDLEWDFARLESIASVLDASPRPYFVTLDGNEQFHDLEQVGGLLAGLRGRDSLKRFSSSVLFLEQPLHREVALDSGMAGLGAGLPLLIDESDGRIDSFPQACRLGYWGVSSKACKGFYKALINLARCVGWNQAAGGQRYFMSAEDLTTQAGIGLQQDLAIVSVLGIEHVERNGHYYGDGMKGLPESEQQAFLEAHPDLYTRSHGAVRPKIEAGRMSIGSLFCPGFAVACEPDWAAMPLLAELQS